MNETTGGWYHDPCPSGRWTPCNRQEKPTTTPPGSESSQLSSDHPSHLKESTMTLNVFSPFFQLHSQKVAFAASYFEGPAKDWVHKRQEFWTSWDTVPQQFQYPSWTEFVALIGAQFHDPATKDVHEKKMFDLRMGKGPAISYFQELEIEAKKAG
ncbi:uncharacterized protein ARMOST_07703 [Armillaria ostoyae]|uniref:Retrotransposon gag domain-containing protein n=1 Tax=Armillaria ostoyae TaxID=47428 RepID=A0A284R6J1_ARMOS|nr:uncharacterized protein ARMOST_07703 [Armillaria ostoyae]